MAVNRILSNGDFLELNGHFIQVSIDEMPPIRLRDFYAQMELEFNSNDNLPFTIGNSFFEQDGKFVSFRFMLYSFRGSLPSNIYFVRVIDESLSIAENLEGIWLPCTYA